MLWKRWTQKIFSPQKTCDAGIVDRNLDDLTHYLDIDSLGQAYRARKISPIEVLNHYLNRINELDSQLKSYATVMSDSAQKAAKELTKELETGTDRGPLHGIPIAVKDLCFTKGTTVESKLGTKSWRTAVPPIVFVPFVKQRSLTAIGIP